MCGSGLSGSGEGRGADAGRAPGPDDGPGTTGFLRVGHGADAGVASAAGHGRGVSGMRPALPASLAVAAFRIGGCRRAIRYARAPTLLRLLLRDAPAHLPIEPYQMRVHRPGAVFTCAARTRDFSSASNGACPAGTGVAA